MQKRYREIGRTVFIVSFDELVAIGKAQEGVRLTESGMPVRFKYQWRVVTLLSDREKHKSMDDCYLITHERGTIHVNKGFSLITGRDAEIYTLADEKISKYFELVAE